MTYQYVALGGNRTKPPVRPNRRAAVRYRCRPATVGRLDKSEQYSSQRAWVLNLSASGVGLLLGEGFEPDTVLTIHLKHPTRGGWCDLQARVAHATRQPDGAWYVGCEFTDQLSPDALEALL
jgi:hypothetical protein